MRKFSFLFTIFLLAANISADSWVDILNEIDNGSVSSNYDFSISGQTQSNIRYILREADDIHALNSLGDSFLVAAIKKGFWGDLETIVNAGFKVNAKDKNGKIPLHHLVETWIKIEGEAEHDDFNIFALHTLPVHEAEVLAQDSDGNTPLSLWFQKPNIDFGYSAERLEDNSTNQISISGVNERTIPSAPREWEEGMKTSLFGLPYAIKNLTKAVQITKTKKVLIFDYILELIKNKPLESNHEQIVMLYLAMDRTLKNPSKFSDKTVQMFYEDHWKYSGSSSPSDEKLQKISKWLKDKSKDFTSEQKISLLKFFELFYYVKKNLTYSVAPQAMQKVIENLYDTFPLSDNFYFRNNSDNDNGVYYESQIMDGKSNYIILFHDYQGENKANYFGYDISNDRKPISSKKVMPVFNDKGNFVRSKYQVDHLSMVPIYNEELKSVSSALFGLSNNVAYIVDLETKKLTISKDLSSIPTNLFRLNGVFYIIKSGGFEVGDTFYEDGTQRKGNLFMKDGSLVSWETRPDGLQNIKIGKRLIEGVDVFAYRDELFYSLKNTYNFISFFEHVEGIQNLSDIVLDSSKKSVKEYKRNGVATKVAGFPTEPKDREEQKLSDHSLLATINGIKVLRNEILPEGLNEIAHKSLPRNTTIAHVTEYKPGEYYFNFTSNYLENYELKTGQVIKTTINSIIPLEFNSRSFDKIILDSPMGPLISKYENFYSTYADDNSTKVLVNKDKSWYYFVDQHVILEAKTGKIYRFSGVDYSRPIYDIYNEHRTLKVIKKEIPNWSYLGEE